MEAAAALVRKRLGGRRLTALINNAGPHIPFLIYGIGAPMDVCFLPSSALFLSKVCLHKSNGHLEYGIPVQTLLLLLQGC